MRAAAQSADLPEPPVSAEVDLAGLDGFMLDIQRLFASELWALSTGDEFKAAVALWGRAWQQSPPGSLPNDERVLAAFSGAGKGWKKVREMALRGFVECSDGRLYHLVLCEDVLKAHGKRQAFKERTRNATEARRRRDDGPHLDRNDARDDQRNDDRHVDVEQQRNDVESSHVTSVQGQGQGQGHRSSVLTDGSDPVPIEPDPPPRTVPKSRSSPDPADRAATDAEIERVLFARGKQTLGAKSGGQISQLIRVNNGSHAQALAIIDMAATKQNPREFVAACIQRGGGRGPPSVLPYDPGL